jgi:hypothetical protein
MGQPWLQQGEKKIYYRPKRGDSSWDRILQPSHREEGVVLRPLMGDENDMCVLEGSGLTYTYNGEAPRPDLCPSFPL